MKKIITIPPGRQQITITLLRFFKVNKQDAICAAGGVLQVYLLGDHRKKILRRQLQGKIGSREEATSYVIWQQTVNGKGVVLEVDISRIVDTVCEFEVTVNALG